ncbi:hypothetical protein SALBM311S_10261 [Streptomyces alboniger]
MSYAGFIVLAGGAAFVLSCWQRGSGVRAMQRLVVSGWLALTSATLFLLLLRGSYTGSGKIGDIFDLDLLLHRCCRPRQGRGPVSRLLLAAAALFIAVLFGYEKRENEEKRDLTFGLAAWGLSWRPESLRAGRCPNTPPSDSRRASRCRSTSSTCWPWPPGSAGSPRCSSRCTGRPRTGPSTRSPYAGSLRSPSAAWSR